MNLVVKNGHRKMIWKVVKKKVQTHRKLIGICKKTRRNLVGISCIRNFRYVLFFENTFSKCTSFREYVFEMYYFSRIYIFENFYFFENFVRSTFSISHVFDKLKKFSISWKNYRNPFERKLSKSPTYFEIRKFQEYLRREDEEETFDHNLKYQRLILTSVLYYTSSVQLLWAKRNYIDRRTKLVYKKNLNRNQS